MREFCREFSSQESCKGAGVRLPEEGKQERLARRRPVCRVACVFSATTPVRGQALSPQFPSFSKASQTKIDGIFKMPLIQTVVCRELSARLELLILVRSQEFLDSWGPPSMSENCMDSAWPDPPPAFFLRPVGTGLAPSLVNMSPGRVFPQWLCRRFGPSCALRRALAPTNQLPLRTYLGRPLSDVPSRVLQR